MCKKQNVGFSHLILIFIFAFISDAQAKVYDWVRIGSDDIRVIENGDLEKKFVLEMMKGATRYLDFITFEQGYQKQTEPAQIRQILADTLPSLFRIPDDQYGMDILEESVDAANRGVEVRVIQGSWYTKKKNEKLFGDPVENFLMNAKTKVPIKYGIVGKPRMILAGFPIATGAHEKILLIDRKYALITDRGNKENNFRWLGTLFALKGKPVEQAQEAYNDLWDTVQSVGRIKVSKPAKQSSPAPRPLGIRAEKEELSQELRSLVGWVTREPQNVDLLPPEEVYSVRLLHHDLLQSIVDTCKHGPVVHVSSSCLEKISDPILNEMNRLLTDPQTEDAWMYSIGTIFPRSFKDSIATLIQRRQSTSISSPVTIFTNGKMAHRVVFSSSIVWAGVLNDLEELLHMGATVYTFRSNKNDPLIYLHRKMARFRTKDTTHLIFGSSNYTRASHETTDEFAFEVRMERGQKLDQQVQAYFDDGIQRYGRLRNEAQIHRENTKSKWPTFMRKLVVPLM